MRAVHTIAPVFDKSSKVLILGTMPSPKSREVNFYYGNPQNRFWKLMDALFRADVAGKSTDKKREFLLSQKIALWDVLSSCVITGASDASIKEPVANDIGLILSAAPIKKVFTTGGKAYSLYNKLCYPVTRVRAVCLPSPSPANCAAGFEELLISYGAIKSALSEDF